jgi:hypothetical protein
MREDIRYKTLAMGSRGVWKRGNLEELLRDIPYLIWPPDGGILPTREELNRVLAEGKWDAGMSGGCDWQPFQISDDEYEELAEVFLTEPGTNFRMPDTPEAA